MTIYMHNHYSIENSKELELFFANYLKDWHQERIVFLVQYLFAIIQTKSVNSSDLANVLNPLSKKDSNQRRIENFFASQQLDYEIIALIILYILPVKKYKISIDRTNWQYGQSNINIFMLSIRYYGIGIPVFWICLDKKGNSNTKERIDLLDAFISIFGQKKIKYLLGDREFVGKEWFKYLIKRKIPFYLRIRENFYLEDLGGEIQVKVLFDRHKAGVYRNGKICGVKLNTVGRRLNKAERKESDEELLIVVTNQAVGEPDEVLKIYKERWVIETLFRAYKKKGFNMEETHMTNPERIRKLVALMSLALVWCYKMGIKQDACYEPIEIKKHGYKQYSYVKYGLDTLINILHSLPVKMAELSNAIILFTMSGFEKSLNPLLE